MRLEDVKQLKIIDYYWSHDKKLEKELNELFKQGWKLLAITEDGNKHDGISTIYTLGQA